MTHEKIVVTGATGNIGRRVIQDLAARRHQEIVAFVRDPQKAGQQLGAGATLRRGTFQDEASLREAFAGAGTVVLNTVGETLAEQAITAIRAARAAGVRKIVRISSGKASADGPTESTRQHGIADDVLRASGLAAVILRPHSFMQNLLWAVGSLRHDGKLFSGAGTGKIGFIDVRDVADAVVAALVSDAWDGQTLDLTGPTALGYDALAAIIGKELGREVTYVPVSPAAAGDAARRSGADDWTAKAITEFAATSARGWGDYTTDSVAKLTGHPPRSIEDFVREVLVPAVRAG